MHSNSSRFNQSDGKSTWLENQQTLFELQQQHLNKLGGELFGYFCLIESVSSNHQLADVCRQQYPIHLATNWSIQSTGSNQPSWLYATPQQLPFPDDSIDLVVIHHMLESQEKPHQIVSEAARVVLPKGKIVMFGSNPLSLEGLGYGFNKILRRSWRYQMPSARRIIDWLHLLELSDIQLAYQYPSIHRLNSRMQQYPRVCRTLGLLALKNHLPIAGSWCLVATKQRVAPIMQNPKRRVELLKPYRPQLARRKPLPVAK